MFYAIKVTNGQEEFISRILKNKADIEKLEVYSIMVSNVPGYIIVECDDLQTCRKLIQDQRNINKLLPKPLSEDDINKMLTVKKQEELNVGDIIEFVSGPFKGYKAKVLSIDNQKNELTAELIDAVVPIPITAKRSLAKVIEKAEKSE
ncbi:MAG: transcription elongation factor Spt5 [Candidatus Micrarchaeota archaeon]|nr:MAG: transcription elongation factor Spt5 [Candidatus Micrarchaeota archaeon]